MTLFPLDTVRNAVPDASIEPLLEEVREDILRFPFTAERDAGQPEEIVEAYDLSRARLNVIATLLRPVEGVSGADISAGLGFAPVVLHRLGLQVLATERDTATARFAAAQGVPVTEWTIGAQRAPFEVGSLDFLVFSEVLEHLKLSPIPVLEELATMLRPGGRFLLTTPNVGRLSHIETLLAGENFLEPFPELPLDVDATDFIEHVREYSIREVIDLVEAAGFGIDQVLMTGWGEDGYALRPNPFSNDIMVVLATA